MGTIKRFEDIKSWQNARILTQLVYQLSSEEVFSRDFSLKDQIRRSAISIMSNIAEGFESHTQPLFVKYLGLARASAGELRSQVYIAFDLKYITEKELKKLLDIAEKVSRQIFRFVHYLKRQHNPERM